MLFTMGTPARALRSHGSPARSAKGGGERSRMMNIPPDTLQSEGDALLLKSRRVRRKRAQPLLRCTAKSRRTEELVTSVQAPQPIVYDSQMPAGASIPVYGWIGSALCGALAIFLMALIPVLQAAREALLELAALIATVREEVPDTAAAIRLPALEVTDTLEDIGTLGQELTDGVRASAQTISGTASAASAGANFVTETVQSEVLPRMNNLGKQVGRQAHARVTAAVEQNSQLTNYSEPVVASAAEATRVAVSRVRKSATAVKAARALGRVIRNYRE